MFNVLPAPCRVLSDRQVTHNELYPRTGNELRLSASIATFAGVFHRAERTALQLLIQRLIVAAGGIERISGFKVLVAFGGGKDSAYTLAFCAPPS